MLIELDVFSGLPNPRWSLGPRAVTRLHQLESTLRSSAAKPVDPPGLGYRGFVYTDKGGTRRAYGGYVWSQRRTLLDPTFSVEEFLLGEMPSEYHAIRVRVAADVARRR